MSKNPRESLEERVLEDIDELLIKLNEKLDQMLLMEIWLTNLKKEVSTPRNNMVI